MRHNLCNQCRANNVDQAYNAFNLGSYRQHIIHTLVCLTLSNVLCRLHTTLQPGNLYGLCFVSPEKISFFSCCQNKGGLECLPTTTQKVYRTRFLHASERNLAGSSLRTAAR
eukprot:1044385-Pelagomonas_calceolata.AAC.1